MERIQTFDPPLPLLIIIEVPKALKYSGFPPQQHRLLFQMVGVLLNGRFGGVKRNFDSCSCQ